MYFFVCRSDSTSVPAGNIASGLAIPEGSNEGEDPTPVAMGGPSEYTWRVDLSKSEIYWKGWFEGLSKLFLSCTVEPKILILAGIHTHIMNTHALIHHTN